MTLAWTIRRTLAWTSEDFASRGIPSPRLDAELLISHALDCDRIDLYLNMERPLANPELGRVRTLVERRRRREPVAYILGEREFYGRRFRVDPSVLIPRPDTETLVERLFDAVPADFGGRFLELGTGSGAIAVTVAVERPRLRIQATDISSAALSIARQNARLHDVESRMDFHDGDLFEALDTEGAYDVICFNPPYVSSADWDGLAPEIVQYEPKAALDGGADGLDFYRRTLASVDEWLAPSGILLLEVGQGQVNPVLELVRANGRFRSIENHPDLGGVPRVIRARIGGPG
jgi:release factor glutamine methyltransferase